MEERGVGISLIPERSDGWALFFYPQSGAVRV